MQIGMVGALLQRASSQMDGTPQLDCLDHLFQRDCLHSEMAIEDWPQELLKQNLDVVHSRTVRIGSPTMCSGNPTQMAEQTFLVGSLRDVHRQPKRTDTARLARHETEGESDWKWPAKESTIAAACVIQYCCCAGGTALRGPVENGFTLRARSTTANARDMIGQNNHDCGPCPGTVLGSSPHPYSGPRLAGGPCEKHVRRAS